METEKHILCGGVKASGVSAAAPKLALNLWETHGGKNISLRIEDLNEKLWRDIPPQFQDLLELAAYVYCCDQTTIRGQHEVNSFGGQWKRRFHLHVPVRVPELWNSAAAKGLLVKTLDFLSDDFYDFSFYGAKDAPQVQQFFDFDKGAGPGGQIEEVMMFSGGLDSLAGAIEEICTNKHRVLLVNHRSTPKFSVKHRELQRLLAEKAGANIPSHMHVRISKDSALGKEYTQRARSFLYAALGATVAMMIRVKRMRFYENGIVSLNLPVCAQVVGGRATRTTHPMVLDGFQKLFTMLANEQFVVENPFVWTTKGDVVKKIVQEECGPMIPYSRSCAHTWETNNTHTHCGVCSQCIDRRFGMVAAEAEQFDPVGQYKIDIFTQARPKDEDKIMGAAYLERANQVGKLKDATQLVERYPEVLRVLRYPAAPGPARSRAAGPSRRTSRRGSSSRPWCRGRTHPRRRSRTRRPSRCGPTPCRQAREWSSPRCGRASVPASPNFSGPPRKSGMAKSGLAGTLALPAADHSTLNSQPSTTFSQRSHAGGRAGGNPRPDGAGGGAEGHGAGVGGQALQPQGHCLGGRGPVRVRPGVAGVAAAQGDHRQRDHQRRPDARRCGPHGPAQHDSRQ